jgi:NTE family protein
MFAVVLSGGGNHGALEAGALEVLLGEDLHAGLWVGTSAGGLNAIMMAARPDLEGIHALQNLWRKARPVPQGAAGLLTAARRFAAGKDSFFPNAPVAEYFRRHLPAGLETFGDLYNRTSVRALTVAVEYPGGGLRIFGEKRDDRLLDGAMATSAFPMYFPPWDVGPLRYLDGGMEANLPIRTAVEFGADEILALEVHGEMIMVSGSGLLDIAGFTLGSVIRQQTADQMDWARHQGVRVHYLPLDAGDTPPWDFTHADVLIERGRETARKFLATSGKIPRGPTWRYMNRRLLLQGKRKKRW